MRYYKRTLLPRSKHSLVEEQIKTRACHGTAKCRPGHRLQGPKRAALAGHQARLDARLAVFGQAAIEAAVPAARERAHLRRRMRRSCSGWRTPAPPNCRKVSLISRSHVSG